MALTRGLQQLQPTQTKNLYQGNYLDFTNSDFSQWTQQFLPDVYDQEINIYGNRTISSFLKMVSAEMPTTSDQIIWTEQGRLHTRYTNVVASAQISASAATATFHVPEAQEGGSISDIVYRVGQTVMIQAQNASGETLKGAGNAALLKGVITALVTSTTAGSGNAGGFTVAFYEEPAAIIANTVLHTVLVYGSEFAKGTSGMQGTLHPQYKTYNNSPIIMKDHFAINGSDTSQIGWIEVDSENGASGYLWYMKSEHENRLRWEDYMELSMLESVKKDATTASLSLTGVTQGESVSGTQNLRGTEGFFQSLETRGNVWEGLQADLSATTAGSGTGTGAGAEIGLDAFDAILKVMDKNAAVEENMLYVNRDLALSFDDFLARQNNYGGSDGVSWGVFNNSKDMSINLGFSGFRRGSYDFYKTDWKYLNDWSTRGGFGDIEGILLPAGTSTVYDEMAGGNVKRPFVHIRYRASEADNRKMKSWITGSVGGAYTSDVDELRMHYLTERCIITQAANNFFLFKGDGNATATFNSGTLSGTGFQFQS